MGKVLKTVTLILMLNVMLFAETVTGKLVDQEGRGIPGLQLKLYIAEKVYTTNSISDGTFSFSDITEVKESRLPENFSISQNYPNPFNPKTRIDLNFPERSSVKVNVYNSIGQCVKSIEEKSFSAGTGYLDLELNGLANGVYIARITINDKYSVSKKLMLLYGSQHLITATKVTAPKLERKNAGTKIDSLVVTGANVYKTSFTDLPLIQLNTLDLGSISMPHPCPETPTINYAGQIYNTIQIGRQCWLKENMNVGEMITYNKLQTDNGKIEKYCYADDSSNCTKYGGLYVWDEAMQYRQTENAQGICPQGWHIPAMAEIYDTLNAYTKGNGNLLKREDQGTGSGKGTNITGFSVLLAGYYLPKVSGFYHLNFATQFFSSKAYSTNCFGMLTSAESNSINSIFVTKSSGGSIRCLKDGNSITPNTPALSSPLNGAANINTSPTLIWNSSDYALDYYLQVSTDSLFRDFVIDKYYLTETRYFITNLKDFTKYYWRVRGQNGASSSGWSNMWSFTTGSSSITGAPCPGTPTVNYAGQTYNTVLIGTQCWLKENLNVGNMIKGSEDQLNNGRIEKYCYDNDSANCTKYGGLYQWDETMQYQAAEKAQGICPPGWHIPAWSEYKSLIALVKYNGNILKRQYEGYGNGIGTNETGFSALIAGLRASYDGNFYHFGLEGNFWSTAEYSNVHSYYMVLSGGDNSIEVRWYLKKYAYSVRCLKDEN